MNFSFIMESLNFILFLFNVIFYTQINSLNSEIDYPLTISSKSLQHSMQIKLLYSDDFCIYREDEYWPVDWIENRFIHCKEGAKFEYECNKGYYYHDSSEKCIKGIQTASLTYSAGDKPMTSSNSIRHSMPIGPIYSNVHCMTVKDGYYPVYHMKSRYFECRKGGKFDYECNRGYIYDASLQICKGIFKVIKTFPNRYPYITQDYNNEPWIKFD